MNEVLTYKQFGLLSYQSWRSEPAFDRDRQLVADQVRVGYLAIVNTVLLLCKPPNTPGRAVVSSLSANEFLEQYNAIAEKLVDITALLADSERWAIMSLSPHIPPLEPDPATFLDLTYLWQIEWESSSNSLRKQYSRHYERLAHHCPQNHRLKVSLRRYQDSFREANELIHHFKENDLFGYVRDLTP